MSLSLRERNILWRIAAHHILNFHGRIRDAEDLVAAVHDLAFTRNEHIVAIL